MACSFRFPDGTFLLKRHESWAYERLAYNIARMADQALRHPEYKGQFWLQFQTKNTFEISIGPDDQQLSQKNFNELDIRIDITTFLPIIIIKICSSFGHQLFHTNELSLLNQRPLEFRNAMIEVCKNLRSAAMIDNIEFHERVHRQINLLGGSSLLEGDSPQYFDIFVQFIANHELAHAYCGHFLQGAIASTDADRRACELVADAVATEWIYNLMIRNTPDSETYRIGRNFESRDEALFGNIKTILHSQCLTLFLFLSLPYIQVNKNIDSNEGRDHPHGLLRYTLIQLIFMTLLESNNPRIAQMPQFAIIEEHWDNCINLFVASGLIDKAEFYYINRNFTKFPEIQRAAELIENYGPEAAQRLGAFLRAISSL